MTIVIVQCRLSSTRLPRKALLPLGGKPLISWVLDSMKQVPADKYILAVDYDSKDELEPIAHEYNWECFAGPKDDVLERFCMAAKWADCVMPNDLILRATADNPFLFYEAATQLLQTAKKNPSDYITYTGLPHGSGVEVFNARSLFEACGMTNDPYDHEHVGPAFYNHPKEFSSVMLPAPSRWNHPKFRTTIDTYEDYRRALRIVHFISGERNLRRPYTTEEICAAFTDDSVIHPILCVPSIKKGHGTGHLRRCLDIASKIGADIYIPQEASLEECNNLLEEAKQHGLEDWQIINELPETYSYDLVLADLFSMQKDFVKKLVNVGPIAAIDEGSQFTNYCDFLLDIIPSIKLNREPNDKNIGFIPLPKNRKDLNQNDQLGDKVLISVGGEDPANLSIPTAIAFGECGKNVTVIVSDPLKEKDKIPERLQKKIRVVPPVNNLCEKLYMYDIVVTHYGFTAYEALAAGCGVLLLPTSSLHISLAEHYGFALLRHDEITPFSIEKILSKPELLFPLEIKNELLENSNETLPNYVRRLSSGKKIPCPICGNTKKNQSPDLIIARTKDRTYRRCNSCGMLYMSWTFSDKTPKYVSSYFFEDYKKQYGRTYLEDFPAIKMQCVHRMSIIDSLFWMHSHKKVRIRKNSSLTPSVLDIGCAMGPFLDAASDSGWQVYGTDISTEAVDYVQNTLRYPAVCTAFPAIDTVAEFGISQFDAVTMWYVIEHFEDLDSVLRAVSSIIKKGGIFAFSTPSGKGVSGRFSTESFFEASPTDHYTIWEPNNTDDILKKYGFKVVRKVSTGHHAERFPIAKAKNLQPSSLGFSLLTGISHCFSLGDTFETYCIKVGEPQEKKAEDKK